MTKSLFSLSFLILLAFSSIAYASAVMNEDEVKNVKRVDATSERDRQRLSKAAGLLAEYEIAAKKLILYLEQGDISAQEADFTPGL